MTKRVVFCGSSLEGGGSERQLVNLMRGLDRSRFTPLLYLLYRSGPMLGEVPADIPIDAYWDRHRALRRLWPGREHVRQVRDLCHFLRRQQADVVYDRLFHMSMIAGPAAKRAKVARVSTIVSPPSQDLPHVEKRFRWLKRWMLARSYQAADALLAVSQATADDAVRYYGLAAHHVQVLPSPIDLAGIDRQRAEEIPWDFPPDTLHLIAIGRLSGEKGQAELLHALTRVPALASRPWILHLVGEGGMRGALEQQVKGMDLVDKVRFHGHCSNPYALLSRCHLLCLPSRYEGFPNVLLEAMACQVPIVSTAASASIESLLTERFGIPLAKPGDVASLADRLQWALENLVAYRQRMPEMRSYIEQYHSLAPWLARMQQLFDEVIDRKRVK